MADRAGPILILDDDAPLRAALAEALALDGWAAIPSADAEEALARLAGRRPALALLDASLADAAAARVAAALRAAPSGDVALVLMTAGRDVAALATRLGAAATLRKPFGLAALLAAVERALASPPGVRGPRRSLRAGRGRERLAARRGFAPLWRERAALVATLATLHAGPPDRAALAADQERQRRFSRDLRQLCAAVLAEAQAARRRAG